MRQRLNHVISPSIVFWTAGVFLACWFLYSVRGIVAVFLLGLILAAAMAPAIRRMRLWGISRAWSVILLYLVLLLLMTAFLAYFIPVMTSQVEGLASDYSRYSGSLGESFPIFKDWIGNPFPVPSGGIDSASAGNFFGSIFSTTVDVLHGFILLIAMLTIAFYLSIEEKGIRRFFSSVTPDRYQAFVISRAQIVYDKIGHWMLGQFFLMFAVFLSCLILLLALDVPFAFLLAFLAGVLEVVPYIGPILSAIPAVLLGFTVSPFVGFLVLAGYVVIQQTESHVLVPQVMKRAVGLHPIVVILALLIGAKTGGVIGAILAVPVATGIGVFIKDAFDKKQDPSTGETPVPASREGNMTSI